MDRIDLERLQSAVEFLVRQEWFSAELDSLRAQLQESEGFVWTTVPLDRIEVELPSDVKSCWVFHLKRDQWSGCHYHPNSVQHMIALNGRATSRIGDIEGRTVPLGTPGADLEQQWMIIDVGVGHEFLPEGEDMTVVSFHTCTEDELEEIDCESGSSRLYEPSQND